MPNKGILSIILERSGVGASSYLTEEGLPDKITPETLSNEGILL